MLKGVRIFSAVLVMAFCAACGSNQATPVLTKYSNYSSVSTTGSATVMGGSIQGTPLPLATKDKTSIMVSTIAGTPGSFGATDGKGTAASFNIVNGITTDGANFYMTDFGNHTIRMLDPTGKVTTIAGIPGVAGASDTALLVAATFYNPSGITTDGKRNLYVADYNNHTIRRIYIPFSNNSTATVTTIAGAAGVAGSVDDIGVNARFYHPTDVTTDGKNLYVTDSNSLTIRKIGLTSPYNVTTVAGSPGNSGSNPFGIPVLGSDARFQYPARITTDGSNLYVTDFVANTISKIYSTVVDGNVKTYVKTIAGTPDVTGSADGTGAAASFSNVNGITSDGTNLYVTDSNNHTVRMIDPTGKVTTIAGSAGVPGVNAAGDVVSGAAARFTFPIGITTDGKSLYVTDSNNYTIRKIE